MEPNSVPPLTWQHHEKETVRTGSPPTDQGREMFAAEQRHPRGHHGTAGPNRSVNERGVAPHPGAGICRAGVGRPIDSAGLGCQPDWWCDRLCPLLWKLEQSVCEFIGCRGKHHRHGAGIERGDDLLLCGHGLQPRWSEQLSLRGNLLPSSNCGPGSTCSDIHRISSRCCTAVTFPGFAGQELWTSNHDRFSVVDHALVSQAGDPDAVASFRGQGHCRYWLL